MPTWPSGGGGGGGGGGIAFRVLLELGQQVSHWKKISGIERKGQFTFKFTNLVPSDHRAARAPPGEGRFVVPPLRAITTVTQA